MKYWLSYETCGIFLKAWSTEPLVFDLRRRKASAGWSDNDRHGRILAFKPKYENFWSVEDGSNFTPSNNGKIEELSEEQVVEILSKCTKNLEYQKDRERYETDAKKK